MKRKKTRRKKDKQMKMAVFVIVLLFVILAIAFAVIYATKMKTRHTASKWKITNEKYIKERPELDVELLPVNPYSRVGEKLEKVNGIVVHYTANPGTTARQNRNYFAGLAESHKTSASSHFIIGLEGEIIQCIPCDEIAYASNERNSDTIAIECCIADESGKFNSKTYQSLVHLTTWLIGRYDLEMEDVIRHYDVTGKNCPKYFVEHPGAWEQFHNDLASYIAKYGVKKEE